MKRKSHPDDRTMRYLERVTCIADKCEDNCCQTWNVLIDPPTLVKMRKATLARSEAEAKRWLASIERFEYKGGVETRFKFRDDGFCTYLDQNQRCHLHATYGEKLLADTCSQYPRKVQLIGEALEVSCFTSCPEVARQVLLHADAMDAVPLDRRTLTRKTPSHGMDPRDVRPYWRLLLEVRACILGLLHRPGFTLAQRLFFITWFCKRASPILNQSTMKADTTAVRAEMRALEDEAMLADLAQRFDAAETSNSIALLMIRVLLSTRDQKGFNNRFVELVRQAYDEYVDVRTYLPGDEAAGESHATRLWAEYTRRRDRVLALASERVDQYLVNMAHNYWMHRLPNEAPDLMTHMQRLLVLQAVLKFLLFSHPEVQADGDDFQTRLDAAAVQILYRETRFIEHSNLMHLLETALERADLRSLAGAVYLIRL